MTSSAPKEPPHTSLSSAPEAQVVQNAEQQQLADAQTLADPGAQEELHSSQTPEADASGKALPQQQDLSTPPDASHSEVL